MIYLVDANLVRAVLAAAVFLCGVTPPAVAQTAGRVEVAGGYQLHLPRVSWIRGGWFLSGAFNLTRVFAVVGEVSVAGNRVAVGLPDLGDFDFLPEENALEVEGQSVVEGQNVTALGGVRAAYRRRPVMLFTRFLIGMERATRDVTFFGADFADVSDAGPSLQVGGGVDIDITGRLAVRLLGDWRRTRLGGEPAAAILGGILLSELPMGVGDATVPTFNVDTHRFAVGVVYRFGRLGP